MEAINPATIAVFNITDIWMRMPLAEAGLAIWRFVFDERRLGSLWDRFRGRGYENIITFPNMAHLVSDALLLHGGSGRRSFEKNIESGQLGASVAAAFGKLGRLPIEVSQGLLREGTVALRELFPEECVRELPGNLRGFSAIVIDGKAIKKVAKRLKPLRKVGGGLLGGKAAVAMDWSTGLAIAMQSHPDGDASEKPLIEGLVAQVRDVVSKPCLFVADRGFCDLVRFAHFTSREGDHFLVRYQSNTKFTPDTSREEQTGTDANGRKYVQSWGWLGAEGRKGRTRVRRIALKRPGEEDIILVTDLLDAKAYPATDLLRLYSERWGIERMFQKVTEVFGLEGLIGSTPKACIFQFGFCMMLSNIVQVLTNYIAQAKQCEVEKISQEKLFDDVRDQLVAWNVLLTPEQTLGYFERCPSAEELRSHLSSVLAGTWSETWWKSKPQPNREPTKREGKRGHGSVFRILQADAAAKAKAKARADAQAKRIAQRC